MHPENNKEKERNDMKGLLFIAGLLFTTLPQTINAQPGGNPGGGNPGGGTPGGGSSSSVTLSVSSNGYAQSSGTASVSGKTYTSSSSDENIVQITGGTFTMSDCTVSKTAGDTESDGDNSSFYGVNSALYCGGSSAALNVTGGTITTAAKGCNSIFATNSGTITASGVTISNTKDSSRGLHATYGGVITASDMAITTAGQSSSVVATDRGGGTVSVTGGSYTAKGYNSAVLYSTGTITANGITGLSEQGEIGVIEGNNTITINNSNITSGSSKRGMMILQSGSGDSEGYNGSISVTGGSLTLTGSGTPLLEVPTNMTGTLTLTDVALTVPSGTLMFVDYNTQWSTSGGTGNLVLQTASEHTYTGVVDADAYSHATVTVGKGVTWNGAIDTDNNAKSTAVTVNEGGVWILTADSYVDNLTNNGTIYLNGHTLTATTTSGSGSINEGSTGITNAAVETTARTYTIYTLGGRLIGRNLTSLNGITGGLYIVNGKKTVINK